MNASYVTRLFCLSLTCFFLIDLALSAVVRLALPGILRLVTHLRARNAARMLFAFRILPAAGALLVLLSLCIPSYIWLEPAAGTERLTLLCLLTAGLAAALWAVSLKRAASVLLRSARYLHREARPDAANPDFLVIESDVPVLALAGIFRPRLLVSRNVLETLSPEQLEAALRHEQAHRNAWDNMKRLLLLLSPLALPYSRGFSILELHLARYTEWAADDDATAGNPQRSVCLADALLRVSRMKANFQTDVAAPQPALLVSSLVADDCALSARIERLLNLPTPVETLPDRHIVSIALGIGVTAFCTLAITLPTTLPHVHTLLERLLG